MKNLRQMLAVVFLVIGAFLCTAGMITFKWESNCGDVKPIEFCLENGHYGFSDESEMALAFGVPLILISLMLRKKPFFKLSYDTSK